MVITYYKVGNKNVFLWIYGYNEFRLTADEAIPLDTLKEIADNALDETRYKERKQLESDNIAVANDEEIPFNLQETLPQEFRFELPEGLKIAGWEDDTSFDQKSQYEISVESSSKENAMRINMYDASSLQKFSIEDTAQNIIINNDIVVSYFENVNIYIWKDESFIYKINVFDSEISSESVIDMIRNLYKNN